MNATETEMVIANDMVEFLEEYVRQKRCNSMEVTVLFMARMFSHENKNMHIDGIQFSQKLSEILPGAGS
jgi:translation initiation factor 2 beta subunit (eIF-2beta)/eIF-5